MARKKLIYEAREAFYLAGRYIARGTTVVKGSDEGDEILKGRLQLFREFVPTIGTLDEAPEPKPAPAEGGPA